MAPLEDIKTYGEFSMNKIENILSNQSNTNNNSSTKAISNRKNIE